MHFQHDFVAITVSGITQSEGCVCIAVSIVFRFLMHPVHFAVCVIML